MDLIISEVQITCVILMLLLTGILIFVLPYFSSAGKIYDFSRKMLSAGTLLIACHFLVQYVLQKSVDDVAQLRTAVNLFFGFPITYFVNMSLIYLLKRGRVRHRIWYFIPSLFLLSIVFSFFFHLTVPANEFLQKSNSMAALFYFFSLIFCNVVEIRGYIRLERSIRKRGNKSYVSIVKWTKWSMYVLMLVSIGFPFMTFNENLLMRSVYGILSISSGFVYVFSFIGYGLSVGKQPESSVEENAMVPSTRLNQSKMRQVEAAVSEFVENEDYLQSGLTIRQAADKMRISVNLLKTWVQSTEYEKFSSWIVALRLAKAKQLLIDNPGLSNDVIAQKCGFCDRQYFQRLFRIQEGVTPSKWLSSQLSGEN